MSATCKVKDLAASSIVLLVALYATHQVALYGYARWLINLNTPHSIQTAVRLNPADAETFRAQGGLLANNPAEARRAYHRVTLRRPADYQAWLDLGDAHVALNEIAAALTAYQQATACAPFYAAPRLRSGIAQIVFGNTDEAFEVLSRAAESDPALLPLVVQLAWEQTNQHAPSVVKLLNPQTRVARLVLARFLVARESYRTASEVLNDTVLTADERDVFVRELIAARAYKYARAVWAADNSQAARSNLVNGSFDDDIRFNQHAFDWKMASQEKNRNLHLVRSSTIKHDGTHSLQITFNGTFTSPVISQLVVVKPATAYKLKLFARTTALLGGSHPMLVVQDITADDSKHSAVPLVLSRPHDEWQPYELNFTTASGSEAIILKLTAQSCQHAICPLFGTLWLDAVSLEKM